MDPQFWRGRRVFVTGHTGFKGGWLCLWLKQLGAEVTGYALEPPTDPNLFEATRVGEGLRESLIADIRDAGPLRESLARSRPEIVFHLAAQPLVRASYMEPVETYSVNVIGTATLLEAIRHAGGVRAVVIVTSDKCYENREWAWGYRENDSLGGYDPYSNSKACAELVTAAFRTSFFNLAEYANHHVALASARAGNVIGGGDWGIDRLVPDVVRAFSSGNPVEIRQPNAIRPWQHVLEPLSGYLQLAVSLVNEGAAFAEGWNLGPDHGEVWPVIKVVERMASLWGSGATYTVSDKHHAHEANQLRLDCSKARARLDWRPRWDLEQAIGATSTWYRAYYAGADVRELTLNQIAQYSAQRTHSDA